MIDLTAAIERHYNLEEGASFARCKDVFAFMTGWRAARVGLDSCPFYTDGQCKAWQAGFDAYQQTQAVNHAH